MNNQRRNSKKFRKLASLFLLILILAGIAWRLWVYKPPSEIIKTAGDVKSVSKTITNNSSSSTNKSSNSSVSASGGSIDTSGKSIASTSQNQWITSTSGVITVEQPIANATFLNGNILSGTAKVSDISYTLVDDDIGVISQGTLNVVNGKFSGAINFSPKASTGRLDVYSTNSEGVEFNEVEIGVKF